MKKYLLLGVAAISALLSSCAYDPFLYGNTSTSIGVSSFGGHTSTSFFVSTGDPRWAYDSYRRCYFDRYRSCYYDPYLYGYYPVGFMPAPIVGCPHPFGWSGRGYCPPPQRIRHHTLSRYDNRLSNYQAANYHWARRANAVGSSSWLGQHEQQQLRAQSLGDESPTSSSLHPSWQQGSLRRTSWTTPSSTSWNRPTPPTMPQSTSSTPSRSSSNGMFGGINRRTTRVESAPILAPNSPSVTPSTESAPSVRESSAAPSTESPASATESGLQGGLRESESSGGLRQFQR